MTCDRCDDIHKAQRDGKSDKSCKCDCHNTITTTFWHDAGTSATFNYATNYGTISDPVCIKCSQYHYPSEPCDGYPCDESHK